MYPFSYRNCTPIDRNTIMIIEKMYWKTVANIDLEAAKFSGISTIFTVFAAEQDARYEPFFENTTFVMAKSWTLFNTLMTFKSEVLTISSE